LASTYVAKSALVYMRPREKCIAWTIHTSTRNPYRSYEEQTRKMKVCGDTRYCGFNCQAAAPEN
jgi:hypothetical protein